VKMIYVLQYAIAATCMMGIWLLSELLLSGKLRGNETILDNA
jgi:hypothetical protein